MLESRASGPKHDFASTRELLESLMPFRAKRAEEAECASNSDSDSNSEYEPDCDDCESIPAFAEHFQHPISYQPHTSLIPEQILTDLELLRTHEDRRAGIYHHILNPHDAITRKSVPQWTSHFTRHVPYLEDTQALLASLADEDPLLKRNHDDVYKDIINLKNSENFLDKYSYVDVPFFPFLRAVNNSEHFLQVVTMINMTSPLFALLVPFLMLFVPFFILKLRGIKITMSAYVDILKNIMRSSNLGRMISNFKEVDSKQRTYVLFSFGMYVYQMYQNVILCWKFHKNLCKIHETIIRLREFLRVTGAAIERFIDLAQPLKTYAKFCDTARSRVSVIRAMVREYDPITPYKVHYAHKVLSLGRILQRFYGIYDSAAYNGAIRYAFGFIGYYQNLLQLRSRLGRGQINPCNFDVLKMVNVEPMADGPSLEKQDRDQRDRSAKREKPEDEPEVEDGDNGDRKMNQEKSEDEPEVDTGDGDQNGENRENRENTGDSQDPPVSSEPRDQRPFTSFSGAYYPGLLDSETVVKNDYTLDKSIIVTGPNASGKTTTIKTALTNVIISQQIGCGFYDACHLVPYDELHCYMNIPDTSARDSLFQAEARRCKDMLHRVANSPPATRHLCIFDELYSGTNPYEAVGSAYALLKYMTERSQRDVTYLLTTHYLDLCHKMRASCDNVRNCFMDVRCHDDDDDDNHEEDGDAETMSDPHPKDKDATIIADDYDYTYKLYPGVSVVKGGIKVLHDLEYPTDIVNLAKQHIRGHANKGK